MFRVVFSVYIRGTVLDIHPDSLAEYVGIPIVPNLIYPYSSRNCPSVPTIVSCMARRTYKKYKDKEFNAKLYSRDNAIASGIVSTNIFPNAHLCKISFERLRFLYAFLIGESFDLPSTIRAHMLNVFCTKTKNFCLPYGCLIMRLVMANSIIIPRSETRLVLKQAIGKATIN